MTGLPVPSTEPLVDLARARELMGEAGLDAIVASSLRHVYYLSGYYFTDLLVEPDALAFAVLPADEARPAHVTVSTWARHTFEDFPTWAPVKVFFGRFYIKGSPVPEGETAADSVDALRRALGAVGADAGRVGFETAHLPVEAHWRIREALPKLELVDAGPILRALRTRKTPGEIERLRIATRAIEASIEEAFAVARPGVTEYELDRVIRGRLVELGADATTVFVGGGDRGSHVVTLPTTRPLEAGDVLRLDVTASYGLYHADLARTAVIGEATAEQQRYYDAVRSGLEAGIAQVRAGAATDAVFDAVVGTTRDGGFPDFERGNVGHGLGLQVHEEPLLRPGGDTIPAGAVLAVEVPYYVRGLGGFQPEDVVVVGDGEVERLTDAPAELPVLG